MKLWVWLLFAATLFSAGGYLFLDDAPTETQIDIPTETQIDDTTVIKNGITAVTLVGDHLYLGFGNGILQKWSMNRLKKEDEFVAHDGGIRRLISDQEQLVSVGMRGSVARWKDGDLIRRVRLADSHLNAALSASDGSLIVGGARGQLARLGDASPWQLKGIHGRAVFDLALSEDEDTIFSVGTNGRVERWAFATGESLGGFSVGQHWIHTIKYRSGRLWTGDEKGQVIVIDQPTGRQIANLTLGRARLVISAMSENKIAFGSSVGRVFILDTESHTLVKTITVFDGPVLGLWISGKRLMVSGRGTTVRIYDDYDRDSPRQIDGGDK